VGIGEWEKRDYSQIGGWPIWGSKLTKYYSLIVDRSYIKFG
jgi:hypothetical protein